jgi:hypothetical protein
MAISYQPNDKDYKTCSKCSNDIPVGDHYFHDDYYICCINCYMECTKESRENLLKEMKEKIT